MQTVTETNTSVTRVTLASLVRDVLSQIGEQEITVKETLEKVTARASSLGVTANINYRSVYQQLKSQGAKTKRGSFTLQKEEVAIAA